MGIKELNRDQVKDGLRLEKRIDWQVVGEMLKKGQYEAISQILSNNHAPQQFSDSHLGPLIASAYQICLACQQVHNEVARHRTAHLKAVQRERELQQQLTLLFDLIDQYTKSDIFVPARRQPPESVPDGSSSGGNGRSWWQRLRSWLQAKPAVLQKEEVKEGTAVPLPSPSQTIDSPHPSLAVYCLGSFQVYQDDALVNEWPSGKGKAILKYLVNHRQSPVNKEILMDLFWPESNPDAARNNLNVAIYGLRQALRNDHQTFSHILFHEDCYLLNPELHIWLDIEAFSTRVQSAKQLEKNNKIIEAVSELHAAEELYQGDFLIEDRLDEWPMAQRLSLQNMYLNVLDTLFNYYLKKQEYAMCVTLGHKMLAIDPCREDAHRKLMRVYYRQKQHYLALRQYHQCVTLLESELDVLPESRTTQLFESIRRYDLV